MKFRTKADLYDAYKDENIEHEKIFSDTYLFLLYNVNRDLSAWIKCFSFITEWCSCTTVSTSSTHPEEVIFCNKRSRDPIPTSGSVIAARIRKTNSSVYTDQQRWN